MNAAAKLAAFGLVLVAMLGGGAVVGRAVGPIDVEGGTDEGSTDEAPGHDVHDPGGPGTDTETDRDTGDEASTIPAGGPELTLGFDVAVPGEARSAALPEPTAAATVDGYEVTLTGDPTPGASTEVALTVRKDGRPVRDLAPYLGAFGHLVAIRSGDLAYLQVHPVGDGAHGDAAHGGPTVEFAVEVPSPGTYRWFFDFSHAGRVHTAAFTVEVPAP